MKNLYMLIVLLSAMNISLAQTASDYYIPLCVANQNIFHTAQGPGGWGARLSTNTILRTDSINGILYHLEEGKEYPFWSPGTAHAYRYLWIREDVNGELLIKAYSDSSSDLANAVILPVELLWFTNNIFTVGFSSTFTTGPNETSTDSVISTNASFGGFNDCIQIRQINRTNGVDTRIGDDFYAFGVGSVGSNRSYPPSEVHTTYLVSSYTTGCQPIVDSLITQTIDTCLGQYLDYYVNNIQIDTINYTVTVNWVFQDGQTTNQFPQTYNYQYQGNNVISIELQCFNNIVTQTYYKTVYIGFPPLSVNELSQNNLQWHIFPNPVSDYINIQIEAANSTEFTFNIYNLVGKLIRSESLKPNQLKIDVSDLANGVYIVEVRSGNQIEQKKLVIQK